MHFFTSDAMLAFDERVENYLSGILEHCMIHVPKTGMMIFFSKTNQKLKSYAYL